MKIKSAIFEASAPDLGSCPRWTWPEFAFIGRSNVGKSSLINLICERGDLAKVSDLPGKTRLMNFFKINGDWSLVDLPGYGYAKVSQEQRADFNEAGADYLEKRDNLAWVFVLIDSRLPPQHIDLEFLAWLREVEVPFALIFTKSDKQSATATRASVATFQQTLAGELPPVFITSSKTKAGRVEILSFIEKALRQD